MEPLIRDRQDEQTRARPDCHQAISILDLFTIGIGPSSSHTVGPMRAAWLFADLVADEKPVAVRVDLYGSLALTGRGHATDSAVMLGLSGAQPETIDPDLIPVRLAAIRSSGRLMLAERVEIGFEESQHLLFHADVSAGTSQRGDLHRDVRRRAQRRADLFLDRRRRDRRGGVGAGQG